MSHEILGLFDTPPDRRQVRACLAVVGLLLTSLLLIWPVHDVRLPQEDAFIPIVDAIMFVGGLITATLLYAQAEVFRSRALAALGAGYVYTALLLVPHVLTFPNALSAGGLLGVGANTTVWIAFLRRLAFPTIAIAYVVLRRGDLAAQPGTERQPVRIPVWVTCAVILAAAVTWVTTAIGPRLPLFVSFGGA